MNFLKKTFLALTVFVQVITFSNILAQTKVDTEQIEQGRLNTSEPMGSKLPKAAWHDEMKESK